jgi:hypothetical protein
MALLEKWSRYRERKRKQRQKAADLTELIERMVQDSDPAIRRVTGYQRQLHTPVEKALGHIEALISLIPGPFRFSADHWDKDPLVHALFVNPEEIRSLLHDCAELKSFFHKSGEETAVALLTATKKERTVFGTSLEGEIVRRDVPQVAVEFYDHRIVVPVATEGEIRRELVHRGLNVLAAYALEESLQIQSIRKDLAEQRHVLAVQLKIQKTRERGLESLLGGGGRGAADAMQAEQVLAEIDKQLMELEPGSERPLDVLRKLETVLTAPGRYLAGELIGMHLNWMGVKLNAESAENSRGITFCELEIPGRIKRVALLAEISVDHG